jgi:hypothetical protein
MLKNPTSMKDRLHRQNSAAVCCQLSSVLLLDVSAGNCQRAVVDESKIIRNEIGTLNRSEMLRCKGCLVPQPHSSNSDSSLYYNSSCQEPRSDSFIQLYK